MFIDIGAKDKEEAEKMVRVGDKMTLQRTLRGISKQQDYG